MRAFAQAERFVSELESRKLRPAYVFVGDEAFFRKRFRDAILEHLVPADLRDFSLFEFDLAENDLAEVLDRARTPSLMAPFQVFFVRGVKNLFGRGSNEEKLAAIEELLQKSESRRAHRFCRRPHQHSRRRPPHGDAGQRALPAYSRNHGSVSAASSNWRAWKKAKPFAGSPNIVPAASDGEDRCRWRPRTGRRPGRRHDDDLQRTGKADALRRREEPHHARRCRDHGAGGQAALAI